MWPLVLGSGWWIESCDGLASARSCTGWSWCWAALNVPVARALASPLTVNMIDAAGGALLDSIVHYLTFANAAAVGLVFGAAAALPTWIARVPPRWRFGVALAGVAIAAPGPFASAIVDVHGLERNALTAMVRTSLPRVESREISGDWRASPLPAARLRDLSAWRGAAAGRNVVMIVLESTAAQYLRAYGATDDPTPNLTAFVSTAMQFERAFAVYPESVKGLFATLCSRAPAFDVSAAAHADATCASLVRALSGAGYRTALFHSGRFAYLGMDAVVARLGFGTARGRGRHWRERPIELRRRRAVDREAAARLD